MAGPALAYWLRCYGFGPSMVERAPQPRFDGYIVDFRGEAVTAIQLVVTQHGVPVRRPVGGVLPVLAAAPS
ncbi:hypothetical protein [Nocardia sp. NPDC051463]|uniref:hypothetical protein n=1 Tax=Nocardia sp. NPDC051463 TaxID=3154845 RepID=UPI00344F4B27